MCLNGAEAVLDSLEESSRHNYEIAYNTVGLESSGGRRSGLCSGEILRDQTEHLLRRQLTKLYLTLRDEIVGSKQD